MLTVQARPYKTFFCKKFSIFSSKTFTIYDDWISWKWQFQQSRMRFEVLSDEREEGADPVVKKNSSEWDTEDDNIYLTANCIDFAEKLKEEGYNRDLRAMMVDNYWDKNAKINQRVLHNNISAEYIWRICIRKNPRTGTWSTSSERSRVVKEIEPISRFLRKRMLFSYCINTFASTMNSFNMSL